MFEKVMNYIKDFLENTPEDIYYFLARSLVCSRLTLHSVMPKVTLS